MQHAVFLLASGAMCMSSPCVGCDQVHCGQDGVSVCVCVCRVCACACFHDAVVHVGDGFNRWVLLCVWQRSGEINLSFPCSFFSRYS